QDTKPNAQPYQVKKSIRLSVANESMQDEKLTVNWELRKNTGEILLAGEEYAEVPKLSSVWLDKTELLQADLYEDYVSYRLSRGKEILSFGTVIFCAPKHYRFLDPKLSVLEEDGELIVKSEAYARSVEIRNTNDDLILDDNFFDMDPGERRVKVLKGTTDGLKIRSVYQIR
ncbi:MAG TPA: glycoside hydrolase family 2 protein, partial [Lachnospiraceae bacterium]|nr:glycoside hydrolase family 2 protein [Lachnospiraceae bacterium]